MCLKSWSSGSLGGQVRFAVIVLLDDLSRQVGIVGQVLNIAEPDILGHEQTNNGGKNGDNGGREDLLEHDVLVGLDQTLTDRVRLFIRSNVEGRRRVEHGVEGRIVSGDKTLNGIGHVGRKDVGGSSRSDRVSDLGNEQDHRGHGGDANVGDLSLSSDLNSSGGETSAHSLENLVPNQLGSGTVGTSRVNHHTNTSQSDQQSAKEDPL